ncbi:UAP56-interacting factor [Chanos chanos]|uniref:UAP56-interacting factor n=1 Tax=Chanos chanos TaxID=29144 RepID=A0A6J2VGZ1_CHACN|nr:UAP56-interacting factor [Chanos chanos]
MNNTGFKSTGRGKAEEPDKVDMSLDDIIRLNKKQRMQTQRTGAGKRRIPVKGRFSQGRRVGTRTGTSSQRGGGVNKLFGRNRRVLPQVARRRSQGVITGLAARRTASLLKGVSPLNRPALSQKPRPFIKRRDSQRRQTQIQRQPYRQTEVPKTPNSVKRRPIQLRRWTTPPVHQAQRDARQATFLFRRGLKVHAQVQKTQAPATHRTRPWRTSTTSTGILTVSIDNPNARTQPEPAHSWSLHPSTSASSAVKMEVEPERKPPKGVPLQFDINSVGKQTTMTLNERFRILKDQRVAAAHSTKSGRFVTVG